MLGQGPFGRPNLAAIAGADGLALAPALFDSQTVIYTHAVASLGTQDIQPLLFAEVDIFYVPALTGANELIPEIFVNQNLFFVPAIAQEIFPALMIDADIFFPPTVLVQAPQGVVPELFVDEDLFYEPLVDLQLKFISISHYNDTDLFYQPMIFQGPPEYKYDYPIGNQLDSDYGIRESMTFYKQRLVLGHRYGRRR